MQLIRFRRSAYPPRNCILGGGAAGNRRTGDQRVHGSFRRIYKQHAHCVGLHNDHRRSGDATLPIRGSVSLRGVTPSLSTRHRVDKELRLLHRPSPPTSWHDRDNARTGKTSMNAIEPLEQSIVDLQRTLHRLRWMATSTRNPSTSAASIPGEGVHNVVFVATTTALFYAFDADTPGPPLWHVSFIDPAAGVTTIPTTASRPGASRGGHHRHAVMDADTHARIFSWFPARISQQTTRSRTTESLARVDGRPGEEKFQQPVVVLSKATRVPWPGRRRRAGQHDSFQAQWQIQQPASSMMAWCTRSSDRWETTARITVGSSATMPAPWRRSPCSTTLHNTRQ